MEPARDERGDHDGAPGAPAAQLVPQWSPLAMSGATRPNLLFVGAQPSPQWSPLAMSGATADAFTLAVLEWPQWSPLAMSGATTRKTPQRSPRSTRRNGARSR